VPRESCKKPDRIGMPACHAGGRHGRAHSRQIRFAVAVTMPTCLGHNNRGPRGPRLYCLWIIAVISRCARSWPSESPQPAALPRADRCCKVGVDGLEEMALWQRPEVLSRVDIASAPCSHHGSVQQMLDVSANDRRPDPWSTAETRLYEACEDRFMYTFHARMFRPELRSRFRARLRLNL
jgi:hypothetical protein